MEIMELSAVIERCIFSEELKEYLLGIDEVHYQSYYYELIFMNYKETVFPWILRKKKELDIYNAIEFYNGVLLSEISLEIIYYSRRNIFITKMYPEVITHKYSEISNKKMHINLIQDKFNKNEKQGKYTIDDISEQCLSIRFNSHKSVRLLLEQLGVY